MKRFEATVYGRVQGVSFRYYTQREAQRYHVTGWVANKGDGTVQVMAEGAEKALERLLDFLHRGPAMAHVDKVDVDWMEATGGFTRFDVRWL